MHYFKVLTELLVVLLGSNGYAVRTPSGCEWNPTHFWCAKVRRFVTTRRARAAERKALFRAAKVRQPITTASHDYTQSNTPNQLPLRRDKAKNERGARQSRARGT